MRLRSSANSALCSFVKTTALEAWLMPLSDALPSTQRASPANTMLSCKTADLHLGCIIRVQMILLG